MSASPETLAPTHRPSPRAVVLAILVVALIGLGILTLVRFVAPPLTLVSPQVEFDFPVPEDGQPQLVMDGRIWLVRQLDGNVLALSARDSHLGEIIRYVPIDEVHAKYVVFENGRGLFHSGQPGSGFFLEDGRRIYGPSPRGMDVYTTRIVYRGKFASVRVDTSRVTSNPGGWPVNAR